MATHAPPSGSMMTTLFQSLSSLTPLQPQPQQNRVLEPQQPPSALHRLSPADTERARGIFVTLHVLFPHELLPALDILDRGLVNRLTVRRDGDVHEQRPPKLGEPGSSTGLEVKTDLRHATDAYHGCEVYYVQSSSAVTSRSNTYSRVGRSRAIGSSGYSSRKLDASTTFYEVRLDSWNCSCPAFSVSAFQGLNIDRDEHEMNDSRMDRARDISRSPKATPASVESAGWMFGGMATNTCSGSMPSCKHILAAVLAKSAPELFNSGMCVRLVSREELAAWGGGWGELGV
ncbi:hypothetical protein A1O1_01678 [Capronia coronata CBS 617.96]|uniref:SWIM-type domain-containing protein n=1 Tax=Capronia coronata CBS 617.96 TaxID=1182541 RepID=W9YVI9_9EURO|nr:uncharacterized protein A1O1_01678 [Capronia coronata CBS 617.96]EXJ93286.1 hypothetical protein A1O1_01678 [Capronia coronata CBS 617.96]